MARQRVFGCLCLMIANLFLLACTPAIQAPVRSAHPVLAHSHFVATDGAVLPVRAWWPVSGPVKAIVVGLHGFNDYARAFAQPGKYLSKRGIALVAYDQRGFGHAPGRGLWAGTESYIADLGSVVRQLRRHHPGVPVFVLGESMGGAVAIAALTSPTPPGVEGLILSAPAVWSREMMPWYQRAVLALASVTMPDLELTGGGLKIRASDNIEMLRGLGRDPLVIKATRVDAIDGLADLMDAAQHRAGQLRVPVLVLYGAKDQVIPKRPVGAMLKKLASRSAVRMALYPEGYHLLMRDLHADQPLADIVSWIEESDGRLPSGFEKSLLAAGLNVDE